MEISGNSFNQPVTFIPKNTGNNINTIIDSENFSYVNNVFSPELNEQLSNKNQTKPIRKKRKNRRLNTIDSDYLPDEAVDETQQPSKDEGNFFLMPEESKIKQNIKKAAEYILENIPLINYWYLNKRKVKIKKTIEELTDINQNVDELLNTAIPYGEEKELYSSIAKNLTDAANILGRAKKEL